ncbi:acyltransferase family protein [Streptomyces sp. NPDC051315]|uniref:acyltransferase family protein n=1 Tax=Streptomyces sp. NPDC051315 TaxID=3365650 RepID=UPI00379AC21A
MSQTETGTTDPISPVKSASRLPSLTGMRWIAVSMVFVYHATWGIYPPSAFPESLTFVTANAGWVGVSFFFVLSGFVLAWSARADDTAPRFWRRRFFKVYPNHFVTFLLAALLMAWAGTEIRHVLPNLLLVQSWSWDTDVSLSVNGVSWSLSCEAFFYALFPLWHGLIRRIRPEHLWYWASGAVGAVLLVPFVTLLLPDQPQLAWEPTPVYDFWFVYLFPVTRTLEFVLGILLARIVLTGKWIDVRPGAAALAFVAGYAVSLYVPDLWGYAAATVVPLALLIPAFALRDVRGERSLTASRAMVWLGDISFAFYLLHRMIHAHLVYLVGTDHVWGFRDATGLAVVAFGLSTLLAWALFRCVESPVQRRFGKPRKPRKSTLERAEVAV